MTPAGHLTLDGRLATLEALWSMWTRYGRTLADEQWQRSTRLGTCDVRREDAAAYSVVAVLTAMAPPVDLSEVATGRSAAELFPVMT